MMQSRRSFFLASLICAIVTGLLFVPGLGGGFVLDDGSNIVDNQGVHLGELSAEALYEVAFSPQPGGATRVLPTLSFGLDYWRGGLNPAVFKTTNIIIHSLTICALALFFRLLLSMTGVQVGRARVYGLVLAVAWGIHPLQVSSVLYVVQRMQTLATLFLVLALYAYLWARQAQIDGRRSRSGWLLVLMFWILALGCKEDAILLPAYTLALELTVLRFAADRPQLSRALYWGYLCSAVAGLLIFLLVVVPHYWHWGAYPGRDFSSYERLLTQGRVLSMYLWQIFMPLPSNMVFYYDWLTPSSGLLQPWTTLPALLFLLVLVALAWVLRKSVPLFSLGVMIFFSSHFVASNVLNLELAFEHRNHFALIGAVLMGGSLVARIFDRIGGRPAMVGIICGLMLALLGTATIVRADTWGGRFNLAKKSTELAPRSGRAWNTLCLSYYEAGGGGVAHNPYLNQAIDACARGAAAAPYSLAGFTNLLVFKSRRGDATVADWEAYRHRLEQVSMTPENRQAIWIIINNVRAGVKVDDAGLLDAIDVFAARASLQSGEQTAIGYFILGHTNQPERALAHFLNAARAASADDPLTLETIAEMRQQGRTDWADALEEQRLLVAGSGSL